MSQASVPAIHVADLRKTFFVPVREGGLRAAVRSLFRRENKAIPAVDGISFDIEPGEVVGFLGPNGAGKTTTLKMLSGLLYPTSGEVSVLGFEPSRRQSAYLRQITMVMGNRNQLQWDLPALDSYELLRAIYRLHPDDFRKTRDEFIELLDLGDLVRKPVRNLSLGERMKVETAAALLHRPTVLFLDEPTIGLDVTMQKRIRSLRRRVQPALRRDRPPDEPLHGRRPGPLQAGHRHPPRPDPVRRRPVGPGRPVRGREDDRGDPQGGHARSLAPTARSSASEDGKVTLKVARADAPDIAGRLLHDLPVADLTIEDPPIEDVIESVFADASAAVAAEAAEARPGRREPPMATGDAFDVVIVGGGAAGCTPVSRERARRDRMSADVPVPASGRSR